MSILAGSVVLMTLLAGAAFAAGEARPSQARSSVSQARAQHAAAPPRVDPDKRRAGEY